MGEVYRARDTRLEREVAIKVLPAELASDTERLKRFEKEARAASALNHPNIVTIYDIGLANGVSFIAMEVVEGTTLRDLLTGPLPTKRLMQVAPQIAEGLASAHEVGIVHRDLKPENVMVKKDGLIKILDFGLAKLTSRMSGSDEGSQLPTMTGTQPGVIVGTVGYMSPEQASGEALDFRSDQFSFGSIVYEMATGKRAFQKKTAVDTLAAILNEEPHPIAAANPQVPAPLRWIVERCHAKEPEERYASTKDLARDLVSVRDHISEVSSGPVAAAALVRRRIWVWAALFALAALVISAAVILGRRSVRYTPPTFQQLTFRRGTVINARYTPDGGSVIFSAAWEGAPMEIFTARLDGTESHPFGVKNADVLAVSSKGEVAILLKKKDLRDWRGRGTLAVVPLAGGTQRELIENVGGADWSPDGMQLAIVRDENGERTLEYPVGRVLYKTEDWLGEVRISHTGKQVAFVEIKSNDENLLKIGDASGKVTTLFHSPGRIAKPLWRAGDQEILFASTVEGDIGLVDLAGHYRTLYRAPSWLLPQDLLPDGRLLLMEARGSRDLIFGSSQEASERNIGWLTQPWLSDISQDGGTVIFKAGTVIYSGRTDGSSAVRLGASPGRGVLSPDGKWVLTSSESEHELSLIPTGPGQVRKVSIGELALGRFTFTPDGKSIVFSATAKDGRRHLYVTDEAGTAPRSVGEAGGSFDTSPDGKEIAVVDGTKGLKIHRIGGGAPRAVAGFDPNDTILAWAADGKSLYVAQFGTPPIRIERFDLATGQKELWKTLVPADMLGARHIGQVAVTRDGKFWAYGVNRTTFSDLWQVTGLATR
jgi:eukaryotic-like serine/threonine-protein kinase